MILFKISDAHKAMKNLNADQALKWVRWANKNYARLLQTDGREQNCHRRAIELANKEVLRRYGKTN